MRDPKRVAERLAGGSVLREETVKLKGQDWSLTSPAKIRCPFCGEVTERFSSSEENDVIPCSSCQ